MVMSVEEAQRALERAQRAMDAAEARQARFGAEPPVGSVIHFEKWFLERDRSPHDFEPYAAASKAYLYAAIRTPAGWYLTGRETASRTWGELAALIGDTPWFLATEWRVTPAPSLTSAAAKLDVETTSAFTPTTDRKPASGALSLGSVVRSVSGPTYWALREPTGWTIRIRRRVFRVRASWATVREIVGPDLEMAPVPSR